MDTTIVTERETASTAATASPDSFNLHAATREVIAAGASADPRDLAKDLCNRIPHAEREAALEHMAATYVRTVIGGMRTGARNTARSSASQQSSGSKKVAAARDAWRRLLDVPEFVTTTGQWVRLGAATRDEVLAMADARAEKARENVAAAQRYAALADAMTRHRAATVADLPTAVLAAVMTSGAAR